MSIRAATERDIEPLCRLFVEFHNFHAEGVPDERLPSLGSPEVFECAEFTKSLTKILSNPDAAVFVADVGRQIIGMAEVYMKPDTGEHTSTEHHYGHLQSLMVKPAERRQGIATRLIAHAEQWAREHGATEMQLETWEFTGGPNLFYERVGYRTIRRTWARKL
jgi:GNAT superfamily N-acetyltransferase